MILDREQRRINSQGALEQSKISNNLIPLFLRYPDIEDAVVETLIAMNSTAYQNIMPTYGVELWQQEEFVRKLEQYRNILTYVSSDPNTPLKYFVLFGDPTPNKDDDFIKIGPLGFSSNIQGREKIGFMIDSVEQIHKKNPYTYLWLELPSKPTSLARLSQGVGFHFLEDSATVSSLLEIAGICTTGIWNSNGIVHYDTAKGYPQRIAVKPPKMVSPRF